MFIVLDVAASAQYIEAGDWKDTTGRHRTNAQLSADYDFCHKKFESMHPAKKSIHAWTDIGHWISKEQTYNAHECMPTRGWKWVIAGYVRNPLAPQ
jgi:hypothetical protein